ncbi:hypothetical protein L1887_05076 [Cichorium endivia]|nr:hypothetical protein L1887_05076 [Cichorium endivia]
MNLKYLDQAYLLELVIKVGYGASFIEFFADEAHHIYGDIIPSTLSDHVFFVLKQYGCCSYLMGFPFICSSEQVTSVSFAARQYGVLLNLQSHKVLFY